MGTFFKNEQGQEVGLCPNCNIIKPRSHLIQQTYKSEQFFKCYECQRTYTRRQNQVGHAIRAIILERDGGCVWPGCHMKYPRDFRGNFALDHIDPSLKLHDKETWPSWIPHNQEEFWSRVAPNLQVLCQHHNSVKKTQDYGVGGNMHIEPWDQDEEDIPHIDFKEIKLVLPGFEEYANPLT